MSYSRKDYDIVRKIKQEIEQATKAKCWMDLDGISYESPDFTKIIAPAIEQASIFVFILTPNSQESRYARNELLLAKARNKHIFFVEPHECEMTSEFILEYGHHNRNLYYVDCQRQKLYEEISVLMGITPNNSQSYQDYFKEQSSNKQNQDIHNKDVVTTNSYYLNDNELKGFLLNLIDLGILEWNGLTIKLHLYFPPTVINIQKEIYRRNEYINVLSDNKYVINLDKTKNISSKKLQRCISELPNLHEFQILLSFLNKIFYNDINGNICMDISKGDLEPMWVTERVGGIIIPDCRPKMHNHFSLNILAIGLCRTNLKIKKLSYSQGGNTNRSAYEYKGKYGFLDANSMQLYTLPVYEDASCFNCDLAPVKRNGMYGYIDPNGKEIIPFIFSHAEEFMSIGIANVVLDSKKRTIRKDGTFLPFFISSVSEFNDMGLASVVVDGKKRTIRRDGTLLPFYVSSISGHSNWILCEAVVVINGEQNKMRMDKIMLYKGEKIL